MKRFAMDDELFQYKQGGIIKKGCGTAARPRTGGGTPPAGCFASGENRETATERIYSLPCRFLFSLRPWTDGVPWFIVPKGNSQPIVAPMVFIPQVSRGKKPVRPCDYFAEKVSRGRVLWCGVQGLHKPLPRFTLHKDGYWGETEPPAPVVRAVPPALPW